MKINEKIDKIKGQLTKTLNECNTGNKEQAIKLLEELGLDKDMATELLQAFREMKSAENTTENVWNAAWNSKSGVDFSTDIEKSSNNETRMIRYFNGVKSKCALVMAINEIEPNEINDEILEQLYEQGIHENDITSPSLKVTYHYYRESKAKDTELARVKIAQENAKDVYEFHIQAVEEHNKKLNEDYIALYDEHKDLEMKYNEKEKSYQNALSQIETLKEKIMELQNKGIFKMISDKLRGVFGNKSKKLPKDIFEIQESVYNNEDRNNFRKSLEVTGEEMEVRKNSEETILQSKQTDKDGRNR